MQSATPDLTILTDLVRMQMPYGRYQGYILARLPEPYLAWMEQNNAYPKGRMGMLLKTLYEIKLNGLEYLLKEIH